MGIQDAVETHSGLALALAGMVEHVRELARELPAWSLPEAEVGASLGQAQALRAACQALSAVLAAEADSRGLGGQDGISGVDWLRAAAPTLEPREATALAGVGAAMNQPRWGELAEKVRAGGASVAQAATIVRFHDDVAPIADPVQLDGIVGAMLDGCAVLGVRDLTRLAAHGRASL